jgi:hypothetical protein
VLLCAGPPTCCSAPRSLPTRSPHATLRLRLLGTQVRTAPPSSLRLMLLADLLNLSVCAT